MTGSLDLPRAARMTDVAALAGVSVGTVSNVLNRPHQVSAANVTRVHDAMAQLGFVRNETARQLRAGRSRTLGYVMLDATNPFFTDVARGIEDAAEQKHLSLFLCNSSNRADREAAHLAHLREQRVAGILITPVDPASSFLEQAAAVTPVVLVDRTRAGGQFCTVSVDEVLGGQLAVRHLLDLGHERIAFIGGPDTLGQVQERLQGARQAWHAAGMAHPDLVVLATTGLSVEDGRRAGERLAGIPKRRRPSAAFCANDLVALGLLQHAIASGTRVPEDLAIVGYDDIDFAGAAAVPLSSVSQPRAELGRTAARLLVEEASDPSHAHRQALFQPALVARRSTTG
ncbi:LacI family DNA-binding transcriptional regulator [Nocardioides sp. P5_E3]